MHTSRFHIVVAVVLLLVGISVTLRAQDQKSANHEERAKAVNAVRLINTAELWYAKGTKTKNGAVDAHGRYASWDELYNSGVLKTVQDEFQSRATGARVSFPSGLQWAIVKDLQVSAGPEVMPGYRLDLLVSADGKSYSVALHDTRDGDGLFSVFSDQNGIIFLGSPL
jgi:hypothetical protein